MRFPRLWVPAFVLVLALFGFGQLEAWPFTSWYMFSHVEPATIHIADAVTVGPDGSEHPLGALPSGLLSHRLLNRVRTDKAKTCSDLVRAAGGEVRVYEKSWRVLDRRGDRPAHIERTLVGVCR